MNFCSDCTNKNCPEEMPDQNSAACKHFKGKKITKGDLIRSMSNEELASKFGYPCPPLPNKQCRGINNEECTECWLDWLNSPAESDEKDDSARY